MKQERELNVLSMIYDCLLHWRLAIVLMVVGALLGGAFGYVKSYKASINAIVESQTIAEGDPENLEEAEGLTQVEIANIKYASDLHKYVTSMNEYRSVFTTDVIDYTHIPTSELIYTIKTTDYSSASTIANKYAMYATSNELTQYLQDNTDADVRFINEFIRASIQSGENQNIANNTDSTCTFRVIITHYKEDDCKKIAKATKEFFESKYAVISKDTIPYTISCNSDSFTYTSDYNMLVKIKAASDASDNALAALNKYIDGFSDKGKAYYDMAIAGKKMSEIQAEIDSQEEEIEEVVAQVETPKPHGTISKKFVAIGALGLVVVYWGLLVLFKYILNSKLKRDDEVEELYNITELGYISAREDKKKFLGFVDRLIIKVRDRNKRKFSIDEAIKLTASSVAIAANKNELDEIIVVGCNLNKISETSDKLYTRIREKDIKVLELDNVLYDADNKSKLPGQKGAIILEQIGGTIYEEIDKEIQLLKSQDIKILGIVVVD